MKNKTLSALLPLLVLTACTSSSPYVPTPAETTAAANSVDALNAQSGAYAARAPAASNYNNKRTPSYQRAPTASDRISTEDKLDVNVFKVPDLSAKDLTVEAGGAISLPLVGTVQVAGLTIAQAEQKITKRLTEFMQDPQVSISRTNKAIENRVTVEGAVKSPGVFPIKGNMSFLQAIALAQGLTEVGNSRGVFFYRDGTRHLVNLDLVRNGTIADPGLRGDDRIVVMQDSAKVREKKVLEYLPAVTAPFSILGL
ncbi:polysaccharide biosynthesis/export family protein [uncultured Cocleimonas sp.]|uniref:polysaccharide biosynthesis/export family protein n=1 Tax=uncultured Cocleimonas sp. TaxID=1051587 RepID=UPI0026299A2D|nr:polysaccharide biosynthesis/export family protein [uncultured Cocleimonas sp.]